jgi:hypothetical protein
MDFLEKRGKEIYRLVHENYLILFLALVVGIIFGLHNILMPFFQGESIGYYPLVLSNEEPHDETEYAACIREVYDGRIIVRDPFLFEHKNDPTPYQTFVYLILAVISHLVGSVSNTFIISDFIFPAITFLLIYFFIFKITKDKHISAVGGITTLFFNRAVQHLPLGIFTILKGGDISELLSNGPIRSLPYFNRLPFLQFSFPQLLIAFIFLYFTIKSRRRIFPFFGGISAGLLFYSYFYYWSYFFLVAALLLFLFLVKKDYLKSKQIFILLSIGLLISIPYWIELIKFKSLPQSHDIFIRSGGVVGREPDVAITLKYFLLLILLFFFIRKKDETFYLLSAFILAGIICMNIQIILGYTVVSVHWSWKTTNRIMPIIFSYLAYCMINTPYKQDFLNKILYPIKRYYKQLSLILIAFFLLHGLYYQSVFSLNTYKYFTLPPSTVETFDWLNKNSNVDEVVLSLNVESIGLLPIYTHNNNFLPHGCYSLAPTSEIIDRIIIANKLFNVHPYYLKNLTEGALWHQNKYLMHLNKTNLPKKIKFETLPWIGYFFCDKYGDIRSYYMPPDVRKDILDKYLSYTDDTDSLLSKYRIDYIYYGPYEREVGNVDFSEYKQFREVYKNDNITIYKIIKEKISTRHE